MVLLLPAFYALITARPREREKEKEREREREREACLANLYTVAFGLALRDLNLDQRKDQTLRSGEYTQYTFKFNSVFVAPARRLQ